MASSSNFSSIHKSKRFKYDVFINFSGEDTCRIFVDHLYADLEKQGIITFKDVINGREMDDVFNKAIEDSTLFIIVLSKKYVSSSRCLEKLVKIMECHKTNKRQTLFPVFYDVNPFEIHKQSGSVRRGLIKYKKKTSGKSRDALKEAANSSGWELKKTTDEHKAKVIKRIVERILLELRSINALDLDESLVGMEHRLQDLESSLDIGLNDVGMIGIWGMGGHGKTTLAKAIFNRISVQFEGVSFVENVREISKEAGLKVLQKQVLSDVLNDQGITVCSVHDGKSKMKMSLFRKKVLIVVDDVSHIDQLEALAGAPSWFKLGSKIIITTRDAQVLVAHRVKVMYDVNLLSHTESICLFSRHAFGRDIPIQGYEGLSRKVVHYASGLPLTIKVLGSFLSGRDNLEWIDALERLETIPVKETLEKLELSYVELEDDYKEIFLDVACLLKGWKKDRVIRLLESCGFHHQIEEMGKNIIRRLHPNDTKKNSRLWIHKEIEDILASDLNTDAARTIIVDTPVNLSSKIVTIGFERMRNLRALHLVSEIPDDCWIKFREVPSIFPDALCFLSWVGYPHWSLPNMFHANNLVGLEMSYSRIEQLWEGKELPVLRKLRFLDLRFSRLRSLDVSLTPNLERLDLEDCYHLEEFLAPIGCLKSLVYLNLSGCTRMKSFLFIKQLESLEVLCLSSLFLEEFPDIIPGHYNSTLLELRFRYNNIEEIPPSIANLKKLVHLDLHSCRKLRSLPENICGLRHLKNLKLNGCILEELPEGIGRLECLKKLNMSFAPITHLPDSIYMLKYLKTLNLSSCLNLKKLPRDLGQLESLEKLILKGCQQINDIPYIRTEQLSSEEEKKVLKKLKLLHLSNAKLRTLDLGLAPNLEVLCLEECHDLVQLDMPIKCLKLMSLKISHSKLSTFDLGLTPNLEKLSLEECHDLVKLHMPDRCPKLRSLDLSHSKLETLDLGLTPNLEKLNLQDCNHLVDLHTAMECLRRLVYLNLSGCSGIESFSFIKHLESLEVLCLTRLYLNEFPDIIPGNCNNSLLELLLRYNDIEDLPSSIANLEKLVYLDLHSCRKLRSLPKSICSLRHLRNLKLYGCILEELPEDIDQLECLEKLNLSFTRIKHLPLSFCMLKHLKSLNLSSCWNLEKLPEDIGQLECLENLILTECTQIRDIPDSICKLKRLKYFSLLNCVLLQKLPEELGLLECLEVLNVKGTRIRYLPRSICKLKRLKYFSLLNCVLLQKLPEELGLLECLEVLNVKGTRIRYLPRSISLLKDLKIYGPKSGIRFCGLSSTKETRDAALHQEQSLSIYKTSP